MADTRTGHELRFIDLKTEYEEHKAEFQTAINEVLDSTRFINGPQIAALEKTLAEYLGVKHVVACDNGTSALQMSLMALGIGPGDEVITVPFTWISTVEAVALTGATPVLVDVDPLYFNMDVSAVEAAITPATKAIMPVSLFGQCADMSGINAIAAKHGIPVIEDAAQSFGATHGGKRSGSMSALATTSFFPAKPLGCFGDGGAMFTDDDALAETLRALRNHGGVRRDFHTHVGMTGRLDTIQAAVLNVKMTYFDACVAKRATIGAKYAQLLEGSVIQAPPTAEGNTHVYAQYTVKVDKRDAFVEALKKRGIPCGVYYPTPCHLQPCFAKHGWKLGDFPVSEALGGQVVSLPMHPYLDEATQVHIVEQVKAAAAEVGCEALPAPAAAAGGASA